MDNFNYKKYLDEGRLLKEDLSRDDMNLQRRRYGLISMIDASKDSLRSAFEDIEYAPSAAPMIDQINILKNETINKLMKILNIDDSGSVNESLNPEVYKVVDRFIKAMAKRYGYEEEDAIIAIQSAMQERGYQGGRDFLESVNEDFASKAQQKFLYANNPEAAKKLDSKMSKKDYKNLPDRVDEGVEDNLWASYVKSLINDIRLNGIGEYGGASEGDIIEDFENHIADKSQI